MRRSVEKGLGQLRPATQSLLLGTGGGKGRLAGEAEAEAGKRVLERLLRQDFNEW